MTVTATAAFPSDLTYLGFLGVTGGGIGLYNRDDTSTEGIPYLAVDTTSFGPGDRFSVRLRFTGAGRGRVDYVPTLYSVGANAPPLADAGADLNALTGQPLWLDATASYDPDGDLIGFAWSPGDAPAGSLAALDDASLPAPSFTPDVAGDYHFDLVVNDGVRDSGPDRVIVTAVDADVAPNAHAGRDQTVASGETVFLDGSTRAG